MCRFLGSTPRNIDPVSLGESWASVGLSQVHYMTDPFMGKQLGWYSQMLAEPLLLSLCLALGPSGFFFSRRPFLCHLSPLCPVAPKAESAWESMSP